MCSKTQIVLITFYTFVLDEQGAYNLSLKASVDFHFVLLTKKVNPNLKIERKIII